MQARQQADFSEGVFAKLVPFFFFLLFFFNIFSFFVFISRVGSTSLWGGGGFNDGI